MWLLIRVPIRPGTKRTRKFRQMKLIDHPFRESQNAVVAEPNVRAGVAREVATLDNFDGIDDGFILAKLPDNPSFRHDVCGHLHDDRVGKNPHEANLIQPCRLSVTRHTVVATSKNIASPGSTTVEYDQVAGHQLDR